MIRWFISWVITHRPYKIIPDRAQPHMWYLVRFFLIGSDNSAGFRLCLHVMLRSDTGGPHDHPWAFCSWILYGGFWERLKHRLVWRKTGTIYFRGHHTFHRVELDDGKPCVTLVLMFPRMRFGQKAWGFLTSARKWLYYSTYLERMFPSCSHK
jgi:hypothetical protein